MMRHVSCILLLEWSTTSQRLWLYMVSVPYAQKDPRFLFEKSRGQPREFWSLVSIIDGSTLPQDCVEELPCGTRGKTYNEKETKEKSLQRYPTYASKFQDSPDYRISFCNIISQDELLKD